MDKKYLSAVHFEVPGKGEGGDEGGGEMLLTSFLSTGQNFNIKFSLVMSELVKYLSLLSGFGDMLRSFSWLASLSRESQ